jgi:hypothetical protein
VVSRRDMPANIRRQAADVSALNAMFDGHAATGQRN